MITEDRLYIGGQWVSPSSDARDEIVNPATEEVIGVAAVPTVDDAAAAILAARNAFDEGPWPRMKPAERAGYVRKLASILRERKRTLIGLSIDQVGATLMLAKSFQGVWPIEAFELAASWSEDFDWEQQVAERTAPLVSRSILIREPVGVVSAITPFNFPFFVNAWKAGPAIAMGNTVVLKPAPWTPLDAFEIARAAEQADIPPGVVNVIGGGGIDVGRLMSSHPAVDMVSFTGSVVAGRAVGALAAETIKKTQLELGGKSALIVLDDASEDAVVANAVSGCMIHAGQGCGCTTRMLVPSSMHDSIVAKVVDASRSIKVGDPRDPETVVGPLIREHHRQRVEAHVASAVKEGATLACGGHRIPGPGFFFEPTVLVDVRNDMRIAQEEVFGPVLCVIPYKDVDEAVAIANDSMFGLGGAVESASRERAMEVARRLRTGHVQLGVGIPNFNAGWGGYKQSGVGREWRAGLSEYTQTKTINWPG
ncbi:MAG: aldehyde dehydrogenase family protein [Actinomycetota bacterium]